VAFGFRQDSRLIRRERDVSSFSPYSKTTDFIVKIVIIRANQIKENMYK